MVARETTRPRGLQTREKVLQAALEVVSERPLAEVQLKQIADRAGISAGHVLYHFGSKDKILVETLAWSEAGIATERSRALAGLADPVQRFERWVELFLPRGADDPTWKLWLELWLRAGSEEGSSSAAEIARAWTVDCRQIVEDGIQSGAFRMSGTFDQFWTWAHALLIGLSIGVLTRWQRLDEAVATALDVLGRELHCSFRTPIA